MEQVEPLPVPSSTDEEGMLSIELFIAHVLRWGVVLSFLIVTIGILGVVFTRETGYAEVHLDDLNNLIAYRAQPDFPNSPSAVFDGLQSFKPYAIISLGLLVLIAIPVLRVAVSVIAFALKRDWLYVLITGFVFAMLMLGFLIGEAGG